MKKTLSLLLLAGLTSLHLACSSGGEAQKLSLRHSPEVEPDAEAERLRRMQAVRVLDSLDADSPQSEMEPDAVRKDLKKMCAKQLDCSLSAADTGCTGGFAECSAQAHLCTAHYLLDLAEVRATPFEVQPEGPEEESYFIPAQSTATQAVLAQLAMVIVQEAAYVATTELWEASTDYPTTIPASWCTVARLNTPSALSSDLTSGELLANTVAESVGVYHEAADRATELTVAVADAQVGSTASLSQQVLRSEYGTSLSRLAAARLLSGGRFPEDANGVPQVEFKQGEANAGWCAARRISAQAERAIGYFREAGVPPNYILASSEYASRFGITELIPTLELVEGGVFIDPPYSSAVPELPVFVSGGLAEGSIKIRLGFLWEYNFDNPPEDVANPPSTFRDHVGLRLEDFEEARNYLANEIIAFSRSRTAVVDTIPGTEINRYAGTASDPGPTPAAYYTAIARSSPTFIALQDTAINEAHGLSEFEDRLWNKIATIGRTARTDFPKDVFAALSTSATGQLAQKGLLRVCRAVTAFNETFIDVKMYGLEPDIRPTVVQNEDDLRCALYGNIEGAPCTLPELPRFDPVAVTNAAYPTMANRSWDDLDPWLPSKPQRWYLVALNKPCDLPECDPNPNKHRGDYQVLAGLTVPFRKGLGCVDAPFDPGIDMRVAEILKPSKKWCTAKKQTCAGADFDERMPLEDELSDDGDGVESSWKHYLALAEQAANESDALGQEYVQQYLEASLRKEDEDFREQDLESINQGRALAALDELQTTCGTNLDPYRLLALLKGDDADLSVAFANSGRCGSGLPACKKGYECLLGQCVLDLGKYLDGLLKDPNTTKWSDPDLTLLHQCVSDDAATINFAHLGSEERKLCVWADKFNPKKFCHGASSEKQCPVLAPSECSEEAADDSCCSDVLSPPLEAADAEVRLVGVGLDLLEQEPPTSNGEEGESWTACNAFRYLREKLAEKGSSADPAGKGAEANLDIIRNSKVFSPTQLQRINSDLTFEARFGDYAAVKFRGETKFSTGNPFSGPSVSWPCAAPPPDTYCGDGGSATPKSLSCVQMDCTSKTSRAFFNDRLLRAFIALHAISKGGKNGDQNIAWPAYFDNVPGVDLGGFGGFETTANNYVNTSIVQANASLHGGTRFSSPSALTIYTASLTEDEIFPQILPRSIKANSSRLAGILWASMGGRHTEEGLLAGLWPRSDSKRRGNFGGHVADYLSGRASAEVYLSHCWEGDAEIDGVPESHQCGSGPWPLFGSRPITREKAPVVRVDWLPVYRQVDTQSVLDGLELACAVAREEFTPLQGNCGQPVPVSTIADLGPARDYLECVANNINAHAGQVVLAGFPAAGLDALRHKSPQGVRSQVGGTWASDVHLLRSALVELATVPQLIASEMTAFAGHMDAVRLEAERAHVTEKLSNVKFQNDITQEMANCSNSTIGALSALGGLGGWLNFSTNMSSAYMTCANGLAHVRFASQLNALTNSQIAIDEKLNFNQFEQRFSDASVRLDLLSARLTMALEDIDRQLDAIENQRDRARRALSRAMYVETRESKQTTKINSVMQRRAYTTKVRYRSAFKAAKKLAFLAKRSIELRLGTHLRDMVDDLPLVEAPSTWESTVCDRSPIKYSKLTVEPEAEEPNTNRSYADAFIGDYVDKLRNVVESYRLAHNFHEGSDVAVISLRDDIKHVRAPCETRVNNLLLHSNDLSNSSVWHTEACKTNAGAEIPICIDVTPSDEAIPDRIPSTDAIAGFYLRWGDESKCNPQLCGYQAASAWVQEVELRPGRYRFSILNESRYRNSSDNWSDPFVRTKAGEFEADDAGTFSTAELISSSGSGVHGYRQYIVFKIDTTQVVTVGVRRSTRNPTSAGSVVAAPMLETITVDEYERNGKPGAFRATGVDSVQNLQVCDDVDGAWFRDGSFKAGTERLCADGLEGECAEGQTRTLAYNELSFRISQSEIETGRILEKAGFALGNFNYRIDSIAVNVVGTGVRDCTSSTTPDTCQGSAFVPYSLLHDGPYFIRNDEGIDFEASLFPGRIEHARGLASERYISNPLSEADRGLLSDYRRTELRGRPFDGEFVLRLWDDPDVDFSKIKDIQLVLHYKYWTRFE